MTAVEIKIIQTFTHLHVHTYTHIHTYTYLSVTKSTKLRIRKSSNPKPIDRKIDLESTNSGPAEVSKS